MRSPLALFVLANQLAAGAATLSFAMASLAWVVGAEGIQRLAKAESARAGGCS